MPEDGAAREGTGRLVRRVLYWLAVTVVSLALVTGVLLLLQSCDASTVGSTAAALR